MKTVNYTRSKKLGTVPLCSMKFTKNSVILDFGKNRGGKLKIGQAFLADSIEHYLNHLIELALKEAECHSKKDLLKKQSLKTSKK